jgi:hypothetical protein
MIADHVLGLVDGSAPLDSRPTTAKSVQSQQLVTGLEQWSTEELKQYIAWAKTSFHPVLSAEAQQLLLAYYQKQRQLASALHHASDRITVRFLEGLVRLAQAHARLMARQQATEEDAAAVLLLIDTCAHVSSVLQMRFGMQPHCVCDMDDTKHATAMEQLHRALGVPCQPLLPAPPSKCPSATSPKPLPSQHAPRSHHTPLSSKRGMVIDGQADHRSRATVACVRGADAQAVSSHAPPQPASIASPAGNAVRSIGGQRQKLMQCRARAASCPGPAVGWVVAPRLDVVAAPLQNGSQVVTPCCSIATDRNKQRSMCQGTGAERVANRALDDGMQMHRRFAEGATRRPYATSIACRGVAATGEVGPLHAALAKRLRASGPPAHSEAKHATMWHRRGHDGVPGSGQLGMQRHALVPLPRAHTVGAMGIGFASRGNASFRGGIEMCDDDDVALD